MDNLPTTVGAITRVPGAVGWGIERPNLKDNPKILTDDTRVPSYPIHKGHLSELDHNKTALFTRHEGDRAAVIDKKLGVDYPLYHALNMHAQR